MTVTFFGTYDIKTTQRIQVLIEGLRAHSIEVNECNAPLKLSTAERVDILRRPWKMPILIVRVSTCWWRLIKLAHKMPIGDALIVGHLGQFDVHLARKLFHSKPIFLDYMISGSDTARDREIKGGLKNRLLVWLDNSALKTANVIVLDTEEHRLSLSDKYIHKGLVVNVGAPQAWFDIAKRPSSNKLDHTTIRVIFFGMYTPLQGAPTIGKAIALLKVPAEITMVGSGQDQTSTNQATSKNNGNAKITWIDWIESSELSKLVANNDICLGIFGSGPKAFSVVPNKVYQGAAVGCALITSDTPPQRRILKEAAIFVPGSDAKAIAQAIDNLASHPEELIKLRQSAYDLAQSDFTPGKVAMPLIDRINLELGK